MKPGEIFMKKYEAVCVKTIDGAVWIKQMRAPKTKQNPFSFKVPSTIFLNEKVQKRNIVKIHSEIFSGLILE